MNMPDSVESWFNSARILEAAGRSDSAESTYRDIVQTFPLHGESYTRLARLLIDRNDHHGAISVLRSAQREGIDDHRLDINLALLLRACGDLVSARSVLSASLQKHPEVPTSWLILGALCEAMNLKEEAFVARYQAVLRAHRSGEWLDEPSTPPELVDLVAQAIESVRAERGAYLAVAFDELRQQHGRSGLKRIEDALSIYLKENRQCPSDPRQVPRFLFIPGLSDQPIHDPLTQSWGRQLEKLFPQIREEYLSVVTSNDGIQSFFKIREGDRIERYLEGRGHPPAWDGFFFYRRGERYSENHNRCPATSAFLEAVDLCRIEGDAPEILFSLMRPQTRILPHFGVTNARLVMHLPLSIPSGCALHLIGEEPIRWEEGKVVMFDDTFQHEAWNYSDFTRGVLLMDCWNPQLTQLERLAVKKLTERIHGLQLGRLQSN